MRSNTVKQVAGARARTRARRRAGARAPQSRLVASSRPAPHRSGRGGAAVGGGGVAGESHVDCQAALHVRKNTAEVAFGARALRVGRRCDVERRAVAVRQRPHVHPRAWQHPGGGRGGSSLVSAARRGKQRGKRRRKQRSARALRQRHAALRGARPAQHAIPRTLSHVDRSHASLHALGGASTRSGELWSGSKLVGHGSATVWCLRDLKIYRSQRTIQLSERRAATALVSTGREQLSFQA